MGHNWIMQTPHFTASRARRRGFPKTVLFYSETS